MESDLPQESTNADMSQNESDEEGVDDTPLFLDENDAEEVKVNDDDMPMSDDEEEEPETQAGSQPPSAIEDMSKAKLEAHTDHVYAVASYFCPTSKSLSVLSGGGDDKAFLHRVIQGGVPPSSVPLGEPHKDSVSCVVFNMPYISEDLTKTPKLAAVGAYDGSIVLYDPDTGTKIKELEGPSDVEWICFHPKGGSVLLAGSVADGTIWMYHLPSAKCLQVFVGHESGVTAGSFTPDGRWALSASSDGTLRVWAPRTGMNKHVFRLGENGAGLTSLRVGGGSDGQLVIVGAEDGQAHVCHYGTKKVVASLRHFEPPANNDSMEEEEEMELPMSVEAVGFASAAVNPNWCATGGVDGSLKIWDLANDGQCRQVCRVPAPSDDEASAGAKSGSAGGGVTRLKWHPTLPLVFTSMSDGAVRLWDARNGTLLHTLTGHTDMVNDLDVSFVDADKNGGTAVVVSASDDKTVRVFEIDVAAAISQAAQKIGGP